MTTSFPGLSLQGRVAILVPDSDFLEGLRLELLPALRARFGTRFDLISASESSAMLLGHRKPGRGTESLVLESLSNFDGLECLIVLAVGLDAVIDQCTRAAP